MVEGAGLEIVLVTGRLDLQKAFTHAVSTLAATLRNQRISTLFLRFDGKWFFHRGTIIEYGGVSKRS